jgi:hypothetical protein
VIPINDECPGCRINFNDKLLFEIYEIAWNTINSVPKPLKSKKQLYRVLDPVLINYPKEIIGKVRVDISNSFTANANKTLSNFTTGLGFVLKIISGIIVLVGVLWLMIYFLIALLLSGNPEIIK